MFVQTKYDYIIRILYSTHTLFTGVMFEHKVRISDIRVLINDFTWHSCFLT